MSQSRRVAVFHGQFGRAVIYSSTVRSMSTRIAKDI